MSIRVPIAPTTLTWAIERAGYVLDEFLVTNDKVQKWIEGKTKPTVKQLEAFSKKVHIPFGYLFLSEPPKEDLPIPFFRSNGTRKDRVPINIYDTLLDVRRRQEWLSDYLKDNGHSPLDFVGRFSEKSDVFEIVDDIRKGLDLTERWAGECKDQGEALKFLRKAIEEAGIITVFNGVVGNSTRRKLPVEECRGFVLVDDYAPFIFVNNADWKSAQFFTIAHELAHIWVGRSAGVELKQLLPADHPLEKLCDQVAAEFLVPTDIFLSKWKEFQGSAEAVARFFKVSELVIMRRALDANLIDKKAFTTYYAKTAAHFKSMKATKKSGGDFYNTAPWRVSETFAAHVRAALQSDKLLYRDAYRLTGLKGDTFTKFMSA